MIQLYDNIRNRRQELGMTQAELAEKIGYADKSMIAKIEKGQVDLPQSKIMALAKALRIPASELMGWEESKIKKVEGITKYVHTVQIPVYGSVSAGNGAFAEGNIESYVEIPEEMAKHGEFFGLRVKGDSMEPDIKDGDIVIVKKQDDLPQEGKTVVAIVNGDEGFCKRLAKYADGLGLVSNNPNYMPKYFSAEEVRDLPVRIIGVVQRLIRDF